jgi:UDP-GlcNAc:undecaprenyl-phosphate/decaprenyl-phosphate GlcNAc-1-phosphate transferase
MRSAALAAAAARLSYATLQRRPPGGAGTWSRTNHRGEQLTLLEGPAVAIGGVAGALLAPGLPARGRAAMLIAGASAAALGSYDDLADSGASRGFRGHLGALRRGELTTGAVKIAGIGAAGLAASVVLGANGTGAGGTGTAGTGAGGTGAGGTGTAGTGTGAGGTGLAGSGLAGTGSPGTGGTGTDGPGRGGPGPDRRSGSQAAGLGVLGAADVLINAGLIAGGANLINLFDLRPGRAIKVALGTGALVAARPGPGRRAVAAPMAAAAALLPEDLGERAMLGDAGANALGAMLGTAAAGLPRPARVVALAAIVGLTAASEVVSFTKVIERTGPLRWVDMLGRRPVAAGTRPAASAAAAGSAASSVDGEAADSVAAADSAAAAGGQVDAGSGVAAGPGSDAAAAGDTGGQQEPASPATPAPL